VSDVYDSGSGLLYQVDLDADAAIAGPFDTWLRDHIADLLALPGFRSAEILEDTAVDAGRIRRTVQYRLRDRAALDDYVRVHAPRLRQEGGELFGERFRVERRVLAHREEFVSGAVSTENCLNCGEVLTGQHCSHCGQRANVRVISLWSMLRDVVGDLMNADSRVWRTLWPLATKPGWLTQQFLIGRRASFTPPFRMYLVLSLTFFLIASLDDPGKSIELRNDAEGTGFVIGGDDAAPANPAPDAPPADAPQSTPSAGPSSPRPLDAETQRLVDALVARVAIEEREQVRADLERQLSELPDAEREKVAAVITDPCSRENLRLDVPGMGSYEDRLRQACTKIMADKATFGRALWDNLPTMMFVFLPLIAVVMWVLYLGSRRYYVEHLVFFVHYHAFFFLAGILILVVEVFADPDGNSVARAFDTLASALEIAFILYVPWYLYRAMRRVYGQRRRWTLAKFTVLSVAYVICFLLTGVVLLFYTALTM
jgi:hypothetical protein